MKKNRGWLVISYGAIALSLASLFLPVLIYRSAESGRTTGYNILGLLDTSGMINNVFPEYHGDFLFEMSYRTVSVFMILLCVVGIAAIILALLGISSMVKQRESAWPFRLALFGLIGTAIPSLVLLVLLQFSRSQFDGDMWLGVYVFITPIAMVLACVAVITRHRRTKQELRLQKEAEAWIRPAGDLPERW